MSGNGNTPLFVDPMPVVASVMSVSRPCMGKGTKSDENICAGEDCGRTLNESEKSVGLCTSCQKKYMSKAQMPNIFMPTSQMTFAPTSQMTFAPTSQLTFAPAEMAHKLCPHPDCRWPIRGGRCSNPKCPLKHKK